MTFEDAQQILTYENKALGKSAEKLAHEIGVGVTTIRDIISGKYGRLHPKTREALIEWNDLLKPPYATSCDCKCHLTWWQRILKWLGV